MIMATACNHQVKHSREADRDEIIKTEHEFAVMAREKGIAEAFYEYAAEDAVIHRGGKLLSGKEAIRAYFEGAIRPGTTLDWSPDFADASGDLGYTYGRYQMSVPDSTGSVTESHGMFHTVWRREPDGKWRFVWD